jgi:hypothetical protein
MWVVVQQDIQFVTTTVKEGPVAAVKEWGVVSL